MKFNPKIGDLVYFQWDDHCSYSGSAWRLVSEIGNALTGTVCETAGVVVDITPKWITTVASITVDEDGKHDGSQVATRMRRAILQGRIIKRFK